MGTRRRRRVDRTIRAEGVATPLDAEPGSHRRGGGSMKAPPLLPEETFARVVRVANLDGLSVMAIAGLLALAAASMRDFQNAAVGMLVAAAGAIELHGVALLRAGVARGMKWVLASQPYLLAVLLSYCALQLASYDPEPIRAVMTNEMRATLEQAGHTEEQFIRDVYTTVYVVLAIGTTLLQGGMTLYYWRRRDAVLAAIDGGENE